MQTRFSISTNGAGLYEFTAKVRQFLNTKPSSSGLLTLFVQHTSCSLLISENADPDVRADMQEFFHRLVPKSTAPTHSWMRHICEGPDDMPAHIKAALTPVSLSIPCERGQPLLGTWQGIYLFEHREQAHERYVIGHLCADC